LSIYLYEPRTGNLLMPHARNFTEEERLEALRTAMERHPGRVMRTQETLHIPDVVADQAKNSQESRRSFQVKARLWMPIVCGETSVGAMCQAMPHGEAVFREPLWPFVTPIHVPRVSLESDRIVQRHVNALALTGFLAAEGSDALRLRAGWFVERRGEGANAPIDRFAAWLRDEAARGADHRLAAGG